MEQLSLFRGDTILVRGKKRKDTGDCLVAAVSGSVLTLVVL
jgi:SOS-response transcriptional repressor LexA